MSASTIAWIILFLLAFYAFTNPMKVKDAASTAAGFVVTVAAGLLFIVAIAPWFHTLTTSGIKNNYGGAIDSFQRINIPNPFGGDSAPESDYGIGTFTQNDPVADPMIFPTAGPSVAARQYVVKAGDTLQEIADANGVSLQTLMDLNSISDPNRIVVGQVLLLTGPETAVTPEAVAEAETAAESTPTPRPTAQPTPTPISFEAEYGMIAALRLLGNDPCPGDIEQRVFESQVTVRMTSRMCAKELIRQILAVRPEDSYANQMSSEITLAEQRLMEMQALGERTTEPNLFGLRGFRFAMAYQDEVARLLDGLTFTVIGNETSFSSNAWTEASTVRVLTKGWLYGEEFTLARGHVTRYSAEKAGDVFEVN